MPTGIYKRIKPAGMLGKHHTEKTKDDIRKTMKRKFKTGEIKITPWNKNKTNVYSEKQLNNIKTKTIEAMAKIPKNKKKQMAKKQSIGLKKAWENNREIMGMTNKHHTEEACEKIKLSSAERWKDPIYKEKTSKAISIQKIGIKNPMSKLNPNSINARKKQSETRKEKFEKGLIIVWNKNKITKKETRKKQRIARIKYIESCYGQTHPCYNKKACRFFDEINKKFNLNGLHAENKGEYGIKDLGYWVDYYEPNINLVIEWNEEHHYKNDKKSQKHIYRQDEIRDYLGCYFINIREKNFIYNKEAILRRIENVIELKKEKIL